MINSAVIEVAIGLCFCFASVALFASALTEAISSALKLRSTTLLAGVQQLLNDKDLRGLAGAVYTHGLINPLSSGVRPADGARPDVMPSYIPAADFAHAIIDQLAASQSAIDSAAPQAMASIEQGIATIADPQLREVLTGMARRAEGRIEDFRQHLATWFDSAMARVSGAYKRRAQWITFLVALGFALAFQVDCVYLFRALWTHPALMAGVAVPGAEAQTVKASLDGLMQLPLGLSGATIAPAWGGPSLASLMHASPAVELPWSTLAWAWFASLPGLLITATAALFGAPFWFDLLQRLVNLRGTGSKPAVAAGQRRIEGVTRS